MAAVVKETLMTAETCTVDVDYTPEVHDLLVDRRGRPRKLHLLVYDADDDLVYPPMVLLSVTGDDEGLTIGGVGPLWHTGSGGVGPTIVDREYFSGASKLSDGGFELGELLYWHRSEGSTWVTGPARTGGLGAYHAADTDTDDPLASDEVFPAAAGQEYTATCWVRRLSGATGRIHLRLVFGGRFTPPEVMAGGWVDTSEFPLDMDIPSPGVFRVGPNTQKQIIINGGFEAGTLDNWQSVTGAWGPTTTNPRSGAWSADIGGTIPAVFRMLATDAIAGGLVQGYAVLPGETYRVDAYIQPGAGADGKGWVNAALGGVVGGVPNTSISQQQLGKVENNTQSAGAWNLVTAEIDVPADAVLPYILLSLITEENSTGNWYFDDISATRVKGNRSYLAGDTPWIVTPLRTYRWTATVTALGVISGSVRFGVTLIGVGRPNLYVESSPHDVKSTDTVLAFTFTPPSGYEGVAAVIIGDDIVGGSFVLTDMSCVDQDSSTLVVDTDSTASGGWAQLTRDFVAPIGTDSVHMEVIAEADGGGWAVDDCTLTRTGVALSSGDDIVTDLLTDPTTGDPLSLGPGTITCPETIPYDWRLVNLTARDALDHYCSVVSDPPREYRCNATDPPTIDVGTAAVLFVTHPLAYAILPGDAEVDDLSDPESDVTDRPTQVVILGAERQTLSGRPVLISATALVPGDVEHDYHGRPIVRTKIVSAGTADHWGYAQALAEDIAAREAAPALALTVKLSGRSARADVPPGDTIHVYHPESGLTAYPDNVTTIDGVTVFPRAVRVLARERALGPSYRMEMRRSDGTTFDLPFLCSSEDAVVLTVGDRLPDWMSDPQGRAEGVQYLADRQSRPR